MKYVLLIWLSGATPGLPFALNGYDEATCTEAKTRIDAVAEFKSLCIPGPAFGNSGIASCQGPGCAVFLPPSGPVPYWWLR